MIRSMNSQYIKKKGIEVMTMGVKEVNENILSLLNDLVERTENDEIDWTYDHYSDEVCNDNEDRAIFVTKKSYIYDDKVYTLHFVRRFTNNDIIVRTNTVYNVDKTYDQLEVFIGCKGGEDNYNNYLTNTSRTIIDKFTINDCNHDHLKDKLIRLLDSLYDVIYKKLSFDSNVLINKCLADAMYAIINGEVNGEKSM